MSSPSESESRIRSTSFPSSWICLVPTGAFHDTSDLVHASDTSKDMSGSSFLIRVDKLGGKHTLGSGLTRAKSAKSEFSKTLNYC